MTLLRQVGTRAASVSVAPNRFLLALLLVSALFSSVALAQEFRATLTGTVADASGAKIPNAKVDVKNEATGVTVSTTTTGEGIYTTPFLAPGRYSVTTSVPGFKTETKTNVELNVSDRQQLDFTMQVGGVSEQVTVEASSTQIEAANADLGQSIGATATAELPLLGRNPFQLTTLAAGVQHTPALA